MPTFDDQTQPLNSLLRGEMSAVETYRQAVGKMGDDPEVDTLRCLESEHEKVTQMLRQHLVDRGAMPASNSGTWGMFVKAIAATAQMLGRTAALSTLKEGEKQG